MDKDILINGLQTMINRDPMFLEDEHTLRFAIDRIQADQKVITNLTNELSNTRQKIHTLWKSLP